MESVYQQSGHHRTEILTGSRKYATIFSLILSAPRSLRELEPLDGVVPLSDPYYNDPQINELTYDFGGDVFRPEYGCTLPDTGQPAPCTVAAALMNHLNGIGLAMPSIFAKPRGLTIPGFIRADNRRDDEYDQIPGLRRVERLYKGQEYYTSEWVVENSTVAQGQTQQKPKIGKPSGKPNGDQIANAMITCLNKLWGKEDLSFDKLHWELSSNHGQVWVVVTRGTEDSPPKEYFSRKEFFNQSREFDGATLAKMDKKQKSDWQVGYTTYSGTSYVASDANIGHTATSLHSLVGTAVAAQIHEFGNQISSLFRYPGDPKREYKEHDYKDAGITYEECVNDTLRGKK